MLNSPIDTSELDAIRDELIALRWDELQTTGQTVFESGEENRIISRDEVMHDVIFDLGPNNIFYDITVTPLTFSTRLQKMFKVAIDDVMNEAIEDFYNEL